MQKVWFRKHTVDQANELQLRGFVQNNLDGSVSGEFFGMEDRVTSMKEWLSKTGSPMSHIESATFENVPTGQEQFEALPVSFELRRPHLMNK